MPETLRSLVHPWECDSVEHFTTAYYYRAFEAAGWHLLMRAGLSGEAIAALRPVACSTGFRRELRAGDAYHIESGVIAQEPGGIAIGHRLYNSEDGELCATHMLRLDGAPPAGAAELSLPWDVEEPGTELDFAALARWSGSSLGVVRESDLDHAGRLGLDAFIHHASDASVQFQNAIGMTSSYMLRERIGFATFGYRLRIHALPQRAGTVLRTESALARLGRSSLWFAHRTVDGISGTPLVETAQFGVHLDRTARRAAPVPDAVRRRAEGFLA